MVPTRENGDAECIGEPAPVRGTQQRQGKERRGGVGSLGARESVVGHDTRRGNRPKSKRQKQRLTNLRPTFAKASVRQAGLATPKPQA